MDDALVESSVSSFDYLPIGLFLWLAVIFCCALVFRHFHHRDTEYSIALFLLLLPLIIGAVLGMYSSWLLWISIPLETLTISFLLLRAFRRSGYALGSLIILGSGLLVAFWNSIFLGAFDNGFILGLIFTFVPVLIGGFCISIPLMTMRAAVRTKITRRRLLIGGGLGFVLPTLVISVLLIYVSFYDPDLPWWAYLLNIGFWGLPCVFFWLFVVYNSWCRDVISGELFLLKEEPAGDDTSNAV